MKGRGSSFARWDQRRLGQGAGQICWSLTHHVDPRELIRETQVNAAGRDADAGGRREREHPHAPALGSDIRVPFRSYSRSTCMSLFPAAERSKLCSLLLPAQAKP